MFRKTYGAGYRAGMSPNPSGAICPFSGRWQFFKRFLWQLGYESGLQQSLRNWLRSRRRV